MKGSEGGERQMEEGRKETGRKDKHLMLMEREEDGGKKRYLFLEGDRNGVEEEEGIFS